MCDEPIVPLDPRQFQSLRSVGADVFALTAAFAGLSDQSLAVENFIHILVQLAAVAVVSLGMTFVSFDGGIDLWVGSVIFLTTAMPEFLW